MSINRISVTPTFHGGVIVKEDPHGPWYRAEDVQVVLDAAEREIDALAAHVEAAEDIIGRRNYCELDDWVDSKPATSLARLIAEKQAEALIEYHQYRNDASKKGREPMSANEWASEVLYRIRQAEEGAS